MSTTTWSSTTEMRSAIASTEPSSVRSCARLVDSRAFSYVSHALNAVTASNGASSQKASCARRLGIDGFEDVPQPPQRPDLHARGLELLAQPVDVDLDGL